MITIVNYGLGNIGAFVNMYKRMNIPAKVASSASDLDTATHVILPGVGSFDHAMELLNDSGMREPLDELVAQGTVPILGVCVGMQILAETSEEGNAAGLGWIKGRVRSFRNQIPSTVWPMPHMGWNDVEAAHSPSVLFSGLENDARFYFLHSYFFESDDAFVAGYANYGFEFVCAVQGGNVFGVQFHPEKSHHWGATLLKNFAQV